MSQPFKTGVLLALSAYTLWGVMPLYFKAISFVPPDEIIVHRIVWSFVLTALLILVGRETIKPLLKNTRVMALLAMAAIVVAGNWLLFIWSVNNDCVLEASLGYYINPLINVALGYAFLQERFRPAQWMAVALASVGVIWEVVQLGSLPWIALVLALSFGCYGLIRKKIGVGAVPGMMLETGMLLPVALLYMVFLADSPYSNLTNNSTSVNLALMLAGPATAAPLLCFTAAANRIPLSLLGFFQYIGPSMMFVLAVVVFDEPLNQDRLVTFCIIWVALSVYAYDAFIHQRRLRADLKITAD